MGPPHAVVSNGPFEDAPGVLSDGESYFYRVTEPSLQAVPISVHKNPVSGTIRLGFDDQNNSSAAVDATFFHGGRFTRRSACGRSYSRNGDDHTTRRIRYSARKRTGL